MFNVLFILFFTSTAIFSIHGMEPSNSMDIEKKQKKPTSRSNSKSNLLSSAKLLKRQSHTTTTSLDAIKQPNLKPEHPFVIAVANNNTELVNNYLNNPYFNPNLYRYKTALYTCVENKNYILLPLLLADHRIDSSLFIKTSPTNPTNPSTSIMLEPYETAHDILKRHKSTESHSGLRERMGEWLDKLFARLILDTTTNQICKNLKQSYKDGQITNEVIIDAIKMITTKITKVQNNQVVSKNKEKIVEDKQLPQDACLVISNTQNTQDVSENTEDIEEIVVDRQLPQNACLVTDDTGKLTTVANEFITKKIWFIFSLFDNEFIDEMKNV